MTTGTVGERSDAELVVAAAGGDHAAFADLYDRHAARIHDLCLHLLRDPDEAADATAEVFLSAAEHVDQLRDPDKCKSWLYAIARHEVYRRTRRRRRERVTDLHDEHAGTPAMTELTSHDTEDATGADPAELRALLRDAAAGLDERDRLVLELSLVGGLDGRTLADALGVSENGAHQAAHRMRERLARSLGALLVARQGRGDCRELATLLAEWDGTYSVLWRKRVARHVDGCDTCEHRRKAIPAALLGGTAFAAAMTFRAPPADVRDRVLSSLQLGGGGGWNRDGFPRSQPRRRRRLLAAAIVALLLLAVGVAIAVATDHGGGTVVATATSATSSTSTTAAPTTTLPAASTLSTSTTAPPTTVVVTAPSTTPTTIGTSTTSTSTTIDTTPPSLTAQVPSTLYAAGCTSPPVTATASDPSGIVSVTLHYVETTGAIAPGQVALTNTGGDGWSVTWTVPAAPYTYNVIVIAVDGAGNQASAGPYMVDGSLCPIP